MINKKKFEDKNKFMYDTWVLENFRPTSSPVTYFSNCMSNALGSCLTLFFVKWV